MKPGDEVHFVQQPHRQMKRARVLAVHAGTGAHPLLALRVVDNHGGDGRIIRGWVAHREDAEPGAARWWEE